MDLVSHFKELNPRQKKLVIGIGSIGVIFVFAWMVSNLMETKQQQQIRAEKPEVTVISPSRLTGVEGFAAEMESLRQEVGRMSKDIEFLRLENEKLREAQESQTGGAVSLDFNLDGDVAIPNGLGDESEEYDVSHSEPLPPLDMDPLPELDEAFKEGDNTNPLSESAAETFMDSLNADVAAELNRDPLQESAMPTTGTDVTETDPGALQKNQYVPVQPKKLRIVGEEGEVDLTQEVEFIDPQDALKDEDEAEVYIPAGSMFTGVLLNGLDAPTSSAAQKNPTPVVMRVKREAVLPNYASIDVRECFVLAAGYGQLSTERAMMRAESLSCVRTDGQVFEAKLDSYIVGTDGKVGMPGRLVSKQGQLIAQTLLAGTLGGLGEALTSNAVPELNINPQSTGTLYQSEDLAVMAQNGLASGFSTTTNMVAKFYLDMAKEIFPVVEVPAGEVGTIIVTRGGHLPLRGSSSLQKYESAQMREEAKRSENEQRHTQNNGSNPLETVQAVVEQAQQATSALPAGGGAMQASPVPTFGNGLGW